MKFNWEITETTDVRTLEIEGEVFTEEWVHQEGIRKCTGPGLDELVEEHMGEEWSEYHEELIQALFDESYGDLQHIMKDITGGYDE